MGDQTDTHTVLKITPLHALHLSLGAKMVPFAGYDMPVQYPAGVMKEHLHTRAAVGLFDVSHMGQVIVKAKTGSYADAALALEKLVPVDILGLKPGRQRYGFFTSENGGILDDLMITNRGDHLLVVVNASCKGDDIAHMKANLPDCEVTLLEDRALVALQGPRAEEVLAELWPDVTDMKFMDVCDALLHDAPCIISRSGYSGEDGFEISIPADQAEQVVNALLEDPHCEAIGLGARDSLRLLAQNTWAARRDDGVTQLEAWNDRQIHRSLLYRYQWRVGRTVSLGVVDDKLPLVDERFRSLTFKLQWEA